ncbi:uncharacterized protein epsti1 [Pholidichthys leucotaenia]
MDPSENRPESSKKQHLNPGLRGGSSGASGHDPACPHVQEGPPERENPPAADRQPRWAGSYTVIPPDETRRNEMKMSAQKSEEALQRLKEMNRPLSVHTNPQKLGGSAQMADVRERQQRDARGLKMKKMLEKQQDMAKRRQQEDEELQKHKDVQREKAERLEAIRLQEEQRRREAHKVNHRRTNEEFLRNVEQKFPALQASNTATLSTRMEEKSKQKVEPKDITFEELDHIQVNKAFLDKLECQQRERQKGTEKEEAALPCLVAEDSEQRASSGQAAVTVPNRDPEKTQASQTEEAEPDSNRDWSLMKLMTHFPYFDKNFLEDILDQCKGDYEKTYTLLNSTMS